MNRQSKLIAGTALGLTLVICAMRWGDRAVPADAQDQVQGAQAKAADPAGNAGTYSAGGGNGPGAGNVPAPPQPPQAQAKEMWKHALQANNMTINFWGKVVDQDGAPLAGALVEIGLRQWGLGRDTDMMGRILQFQRITKADGGFELLNVRGDGFEVNRITKEGYTLSLKATIGFDYMRGATSNPAEPATFRMWKMQAPQRLIKSRKDTRMPYDGTPIFVDLLEGKKVTEAGNGDLRIVLKRFPLVVSGSGKVPYDWSATIEAINGGLQASTDEFMFHAPADGYQPRLEIAMPLSATNWSPIVKTAFYWRGREGRCFGRINLMFDTDWPEPTTGFSFEAVVNPNGSPILE